MESVPPLEKATELCSIPYEPILVHTYRRFRLFLLTPLEILGIRKLCIKSIILIGQPHETVLENRTIQKSNNEVSY